MHTEPPPPVSASSARLTFLSTQLSFFLLTFVGWLATGRILYEVLFPRWLWLGRPFLTLSLTAGLTFFTWLLWQRWGRQRLSPVVLMPLLLNLIYLADPVVDLGRSRFIFAAALWLVLLFWAARRRRADTAVWRWLGPLLVTVALLPVYLSTMSRTVGQADTFEFQVVAPQLGIAHPTGYPLYLLLGKLFSLLPFGSVAWRINVGTAVLATIALIFFFKFLWELWGVVETAVLGAVVMGLTSTLWSQAIAAEVYALHGLVVCVALWLMGRVGSEKWEVKSEKLQVASSRALRSLRFSLLFLAFMIGLGLTNHLTTLFLLPPAALTVVLVLFWPGKSETQRDAEETQSYTEKKELFHRSLNTEYSSLITDYRFLLKLLFAFTAPLLLYLYLPLRWQAVNGDTMGLNRFVDWVIGGRFQGALQWGAWLNDTARYGIVGRLFVDNWGEFNLVLALLGLGYLAWRQWRLAVVLGITWLGFTFYCLNYYVPDLAVFLIPAQLVVGLFWASGVTAVCHIITRRLNHDSKPLVPVVRTAVLLLILLPTLILVVNNRARLDSSAADGRTIWGRAVLQLPLSENAAILADSDKFPPLYYLQQAEGLRPDLDIVVLPDEAAYRAELEARLAAGQTVYLARFLPGLEGSYHLRAVGPLVEVSTEPLTALPSGVATNDWTFGSIRLLGYELQQPAATDPTKTAVTFYWQATEPISEVLHVYTRYENFPAGAGQHPANNSYPTVAWEPGEIVSDYHEIPSPIITSPTEFSLQVALAPPFTPPQEIEWQFVALIFEAEATPQRVLPRPLRMVVGETTLTSADFPSQTRPQQPLPLTISGSGSPDQLDFRLQSAMPIVPPLLDAQLPTAVGTSPFTKAAKIETDVNNGTYTLAVTHSDGARCGWMQPVTQFCSLGEVLVSGVPLPEGATNFEDKIALLTVDLPDMMLQPGGLLDLTLTWQALVPLAEDYTVFVQVLDAQDTIVGQVDSWPVQGTFPTSQWTPGETVVDRYQVQLAGELPTGPYRVQVGLYLLQTLRRLSVLDSTGTAVDDKLLISGLTVAE